MRYAHLKQKYELLKENFKNERQTRKRKKNSIGAILILEKGRNRRKKRSILVECQLPDRRRGLRKLN